MKKNECRKSRASVPLTSQQLEPNPDADMDQDPGGKFNGINADPDPFAAGPILSLGIKRS